MILDKLQGTRAFYRTCIKRGADMLAEVQSIWCCPDAATLRPVRVGLSIQERFLAMARGVTSSAQEENVGENRSILVRASLTPASPKPRQRPALIRVFGELRLRLRPHGHISAPR